MDEARLEALFREHYAAVLAYARRRSTQAESDDVVAETFLVAWQKIDAVPSDALPWLLGVARRVLSTRRRSAKRRVSLVERLRAVDQQRPFDEHPSVDGAALAAFARLSAVDQETLTLIAWEGLTPREAAVVLGDSPTTFRLRLHRARRRFMRELEKPSADSATAPTRVAATRGGSAK